MTEIFSSRPLPPIHASATWQAGVETPPVRSMQEIYKGGLHGSQAALGAEFAARPATPNQRHFNATMPTAVVTPLL